MVPTLAVEKYQSVVGTQPPHRERSDDLGGVRNALPGEVDRRRKLREDLGGLGGSLRFDLVGSENIDGHCQLVGGGMAGARADYDFGEGDRGAADDKVPHDSLSFGDGDRRSRRGVAKSAKSYRVSAARHATDRVVTIVAAGRSQATRLQNNDGLADCRTGRVSDSTANCSWVLSKDQYDLDKIRFVGRISPYDLAKALAATDLHIYLTVPFVLSWSLAS